MKVKLKSKIRATIIFLLFVLLHNINVFGQGGPGFPEDCDPNVEECDPDVPVPLDGGTIILIAIGITFGLKKYLDYKKEKALEIN